MRQPAVLLTVILCFFAFGCSSSPEGIQPSYVSPLEYQSYDCEQIAQEMGRVGRRVQEVTGQQADESQGDAVAMGVGLIIFWPALFFLIGDDREEELGRLKGMFNALEQAAIGKKCNLLLEQLARDREQAKKIREKQKSREIEESEDTQ